jgi:hypothetical protein
MNKKYWQRAGNPKWGSKMLAQDIQRIVNPLRQEQSQVNNNYNGRPPQTIVEGSNQVDRGSPTYVYNNYNYPSQPNYKSFQTISLWKMVFLILFLVVIVVITFYLITDPEMLVESGEKIVHFLHQI